MPDLQPIPLHADVVVGDAIVTSVEPLAVSTRVAAAMLSVSERTLFSLTKPRGPIRPIRTGQRLLYPVVELRRWIDSELQKEVIQPQQRSQEKPPRERRGGGG